MDVGQRGARAAAALRPPCIDSYLISSPVQTSLKVSTQARVSSVSAAICNAPETAHLLACVPEAGALREKLAEPLLFQHWDEPTQRAIWIAGDGIHVRCVTVSGLSVFEMADMWVSLGERISRAKFNLSPQLVRDMIEAEIEVSVALVN